jgi:hypothetical protein
MNFKTNKMKKIILIIMLVLVSCFVHAQGTQFFWEQIKPIDAQVELMAPDTDDLLLIQDVSDGDLRKSVKVGSIFDMRLPIDTIPTDIVDANWQEYIANHSEGSAWTVDVNGVNYQTGNVGVGTESASHSGLSVVNDYTFAGLYVRNNIATGNVYGIHSTVMSTGSSNAIAGYVNNGGVNSAAVRGTNSSTTTELHYGAVFESALGSNGIAVSARGGLVDIQSGLTGIIQTKERASSSDTPISGFGNWYFKDDGLPYGMNDAGTEYDLTGVSTTNFPTAPSSATDTGTTGEVRITATYIYVCTATDTWVRTQLTTW